MSKLFLSSYLMWGVIFFLIVISVYVVSKLWKRKKYYYDLSSKIKRKREIERPVVVRLGDLDEKHVVKYGMLTGGIEKRDLLDKKKEKFLNLSSIRFHFVDKEQVESYYNDYFKEPTIENLMSEITGEVSVDVKAGLPQIIESRIGSADIQKWMSTIKIPGITLHRKFLRYQRETIKNEQVILGIEEVEVELTELNEFERTIRNLKQNFGLEIEDEELNYYRAKLKEKAAEKTLSRLEKITGWVLVEGKFRIDKQGHLYKCVYDHPVNEYLTEHMGPVTIVFFIDENNLEPHVLGNYAQSIGRLIPLRVYGQVWAPIDRNAGIWELQITPLAVY